MAENEPLVPRGHSLAPTSAADRFDTDFFDKLDLRLEAILHRLAAGENLTQIRLEVRDLCNDVTHSNTDRRLGVERNKLLQPGWKEAWSRRQPGEIGKAEEVCTALFLDLGDWLTDGEDTP